MLLGSFAFAVMASLAGLVGTRCDWQLVACARAGLVCLFVLFLALRAGVTLVVFRPAVLWVRSVAGSLSMVCTFYAFTRLHVAEVLTLTNTFPIWVALLSWPLLGDWPAPSAWVAVVGAVLGVALIEHPQQVGDPWAVTACLAAALFTSVAMLGLHQLGGLDGRAIVVHFSAVAFVFCLASYVLLPRSHALLDSLDATTVLLLLGVGVTATVGQLCLTKAFTTGSPTKVSVVGLTQVIFALAIEAGLGRLCETRELVGIALVLAPTAWLMLRKSQ